MEEIPVVKEPLTPAQPSEGTTPTVPAEEGTPSAPGSKTDSELLLKSLQEEREKRRILEEELSSLKSSPPSDEVFSDEGLALKKQLDAMNEKFSALEEEKNLEKLYNQYPLLRESSDKFTEFRKSEHPRAKLESVAKLFMAENGLLEPQRIGLEKPTGGLRTPTSQGMTLEEIADLRANNWKKYKDMAAKGLIIIKD